MKKIFRPHPSLRPYIECFFIIQTEKTATNSPCIEELVIPDGTHGILFVQNASINRYAAADKNSVHHLHQSYVFGQKTRSVYYRFKPNGLDCIGVKLRPNGLSAFSKEALYQLTDCLIEAELIFGKRIKELEEGIFNENNHESKLYLMNAWFQKHLLTTKNNDHLLITSILKDIHQFRGQIGLQAILDNYHLGYKKLERLFKHTVGLTPKVYCRLIRFNAALYLFEQKDTLTNLAYMTGHFDQMHFIKEVKQFTSLTPKILFQDNLIAVAEYQKDLIRKRFH